MISADTFLFCLYVGSSLFGVVSSLRSIQTLQRHRVGTRWDSYFSGLSVNPIHHSSGNVYSGIYLSDNRAGNEMENMNGERVERGPIAPSRNDICETFISGYIGTEPKEIYLANGHYLLTFSLAVVGHYEAVHDWEMNKPAETMWINIEMWDDVAKSNLEYLRKGSPVAGRGVLILNKWVDKKTGEDRKAFKLRLTTLSSQQEIIDFLCRTDPVIQHPSLPVAEYGMPATSSSYGNRDGGDNYGRGNSFGGSNQGNQANQSGRYSSPYPPSRFNNDAQPQQPQSQQPKFISSGRAASNFQSRPQAAARNPVAQAPVPAVAQRNVEYENNMNAGRNMNMDDIPF